MTTPTPYRHPDPRLRIITKALRKPGTARQPAVMLTGSAEDGCGLWQRNVDELAVEVFTALYGRPVHHQATPREQAELVTVELPAGKTKLSLPMARDHAAVLAGVLAEIDEWDEVHALAAALRRAAGIPASPLQRAEEAKRRRDLGGELGALIEGQRALESAPWYPGKAGDIMHIHYEQTASVPERHETYLVEHSAEEDGLIVRLLHHSPGMLEPGAFAPGMFGDPYMEAWFEAGPHRLTIVRGGRVVHNGADLVPDRP